MIKFILINILFVSTGGIIYIFLKTLPRLEEADSPKINALDKFIISDLPHKIDYTFNLYFGKFLRKIKVLLLKFDNYLSEKIKKLNSKTDIKKIDFSDLNNNLEDSGKNKIENQNENKILLDD